MSLYLGNTMISGIGRHTVSNSNNLLDFKWSDHIITNIEWLRADTFSWHNGSVYGAVYQHLVSDLSNATSSTETIGSYTIIYYLAEDGHKIVLPDMEETVSNIYNESGVAWYYVLDTVNKRFKLPRENPLKEELIELLSAPVKGTGKSLGFYNGTSNFSILGGGNGAVYAFDGIYYSNVGTKYTGSRINHETSAGLTTDASKSGAVTDLTLSTKNSTYKGKKYLYFYAGNYTQTATEQTAGLNAELFNAKVDLDGKNATFAHIVETYSNGTSWYRVYSDGWCEQGGYIAHSETSQTISLLKQMANTDYTVFLQAYYNAVPSGTHYFCLGAKTTSDFIKYSVSSGGFTGCYWQACGYTA